jgi:hypothetical protein
MLFVIPFFVDQNVMDVQRARKTCLGEENLGLTGNCGCQSVFFFFFFFLFSSKSPYADELLSEKLTNILLLKEKNG